VTAAPGAGSPSASASSSSVLRPISGSIDHEFSGATYD
jgi:hypothetical protein